MQSDDLNRGRTDYRETQFATEKQVLLKSDRVQRSMANIGYGTTFTDAGVGIGLKGGNQQFDKKNIN